MKRLVTALLGASIGAATLAAPLASASPAAVSVAGATTDFCAADFGYGSTSVTALPQAVSAQPALIGTRSEDEASAEVTTVTAHMVRNIKQSGGSNPGPITAVGDTVFFPATAVGGRELYRSNGTALGTRRVKDIRPGGASSDPHELTAVGSLLYFSADDGTHGRELFVTDGTSAGTRLVKDISSAGSSSPQELANVNGALYFSADGNGGRELWKSDGTSSGTRRVKDLRVGPKGSYPDQIISVGSTAYFAAFDKSMGVRQVWRTDGSAAGTYPLNGNEFYRDPRTITRVGNLVHFLGDSSGCAPSTFLLRTDGTNEGTVIVADANGEENWGDGLLATSFKNRLFLVEYGNLEKVNQAGNGLVTVKSFDDPQINGDGHVVDMLRVGPTLYLLVDVVIDDEVVANRQLWESDGTGSGTHPVYLWDAMYVDPMMTSLNGQLYFWSEGTDGPDIWTSDGTNAGTGLAAEIHAPFEQSLTAAGDSIYFSHDDGIHGRELWSVTP